MITSFDATLKSYSQIRKILEKVTDYPIDLKSELRSISHDVEKLADIQLFDYDEKKSAIVFISNQLNLQSYDAYGRRYSPSVINTAVSFCRPMKFQVSPKS